MMAIHYVFFACLALVTSFSGAQCSSYEEQSLVVSLKLDELDFDDECKSYVMPYEWDRISGTDDLGTKVLEEFAEKQRKIAIENIVHTKGEVVSRPADVARKLDLISSPGDIILPKEKMSKLLTFSDDVSKTIAKRRSDCEQCDLTSGDPDQLLETWNKLAMVKTESDDLRNRYPEILNLTVEAAEGNGYPSVESYWLMLSELEEDGYEKAKTLWEEVKPLYQNLRHWVAKSLGLDISKDTRIPSHFLGSRLGLDWTSLADLVLSTNNCKQVFDEIKTSLIEKKMSSKVLYQTAESMNDFLKIGKLALSFWRDSRFEQTCPAKIADPCRSELRVAACNESTWSNYLDGHEITIRGIQTHLLMQQTEPPTELGYMLINGNRFSAIDTGISGLAALIASNQHYLSQKGLLNLPKNTCVKDALLMLIALRVLPKLPYYLAADLARLEAIKTNSTADIGKIWHKFKYDDDMQGTSTPESEWWGFLEDTHIAENRPYISYFYGIFLQFHLFEELLMKDEGTTSDGQHFIISRDELRQLLELGKTKKWPELLADTFQITKITSLPLLRFFTSLNKLIAPISSKVPKETRTAADIVPTPPTKVLVNTNKNNNINTTSSTNVTSEMKGTEASSGTLEENEPNVDVVTYVLIGCGIVLAIALVVFLANYGRRKCKKTQEYQRPTNQPA